MNAKSAKIILVVTAVLSPLRVAPVHAQPPAAATQPAPPAQRHVTPEEVEKATTQSKEFQEYVVTHYEMSRAFGGNVVDIYLDSDALNARQPQFRGRVVNVYSFGPFRFLELERDKTEGNVKFNLNALLAVRQYKFQTVRQRTDAEVAYYLGLQDQQIDSTFSVTDLYLDLEAVRQKKPTLKGLQANGVYVFGTVHLARWWKPEGNEFWLLNPERIVMAAPTPKP